MQNPHIPPVPPVADGVARPLWSVMIPTYNSADYLRETLACVLAQDPGLDVMQIMVVDNCSTDDTAAVVAELGKGRVEFLKQPENVGPVKNFETCIEQSRGHLIHLLHCDDHIRDGFYTKMAQLFEKHPEIGSAFCRHIIMDEDGHWQSLSILEQTESGVLPREWVNEMVGFIRIQPPALVVRREVYENLGWCDRRLEATCDDWEMCVRLCANYPVGFEVEPLAMWRKHSKSLTNRIIMNGTYIAKMREAIEIFESYLTGDAKAACKQARLNTAYHALEIASELLKTGEINSAMLQIQQAIKTDKSWRVIRSIGRILLLDTTRALGKKRNTNNKITGELVRSNA